MISAVVSMLLFVDFTNPLANKEGILPKEEKMEYFEEEIRKIW